MQCLKTFFFKNEVINRFYPLLSYPLDKARRKAPQFKDVPVLDVDHWPSKEQLGLDESQYKALKIALTKEVAVIQGPPGTGKTFIGLKV